MNSNKHYSIFNSDEYYVPEKKEKSDPIMRVAYLMLALVVLAFILNGVLLREEAKMHEAEQALQSNP